MSKLGWVDFSSEDREQVSKILAMLKEPGTLDELGIGQIRDAFADLLFPGFSTVQTRAKYLILVPTILKEYHHLNVKQPILEYLKEREDEVAKLLDIHHPSSTEGIIGRTMVNKDGVAKRPSSVYWNAFRQFEIIHTFMSLNEFSQKYSKIIFQVNSTQEHDEGIDESSALREAILTPNGYSSNWLEEVTLDLNYDEADFLYRKMTTSSYVKDSVSTQLFLSGLMQEALEQYTALQKNKEHLDFDNSLDLLEDLVLRSNDISKECAETLTLANEFSLAMEGPHIRYNIVLATKENYENEELAEHYKTLYKIWEVTVKKRKTFSSGCSTRWLQAAKREHSRAFNDKTVGFIEKWSVLMQSGANDEVLDDLVKHQALTNKGKRSILHKNIQHAGWVGIRRLDYRWSSAVKILQDIVDGLNNDSTK